MIRQKRNTRAPTSPSNYTARVGSRQTLVNTLKQKVGTQEASASRTRAQLLRGKCSQTNQKGTLARSHAPVDSAEAHVTLKMQLQLMPWGRKRHSYFSYSYHYPLGHVHIHEVLHGVLYPETHDNGLKK